MWQRFKVLWGQNIYATLDAELKLLRQLISLEDNGADVVDSLRTNHLDDFRHRSAIAETHIDFFKEQWGKVHDSLRTNH